MSYMYEVVQLPDADRIYNVRYRHKWWPFWSWMANGYTGWRTEFPTVASATYAAEKFLRPEPPEPKVMWRGEV